MNKARLLGFGILALMGLIIAPFWLSPTVPPSMQTNEMKKQEREKLKKEEGVNIKVAGEEKKEEKKEGEKITLTSYQSQDQEGNALPILEGDKKGEEKTEPLVYSREPVIKNPKTSFVEKGAKDMAEDKAETPAMRIDAPEPKREVVKKTEPKREVKKEPPKKEPPKKEVVKKQEPKKEREVRKVEPKREIVKKTEPKREAPRPVEKIKRPAPPKLELTSIRSNPPSKEERRNASERRIIEATREAQRREAPRPVEKRRVQSSYLQVGAFAQRANADKVANNLRRNGFSVSLRNEQGLTKVFVGPVPENQIRTMQQRLSRAGHESRRVN